MSAAKKPPVFLIDGSGYIFRAYYAVRRLSTSDGFASNAVFGFTNMLLKLLKDQEPAYLAIAFDPGGKNFRHEIYPEYKANRPPPPEDLPPQIPVILETVDAFRIPKLIKPGFEADDVLGTVARRLKAMGYPVRIVTGDKDLMQLVDDDIHLIDEMRSQKATTDKPEVDAAEVEAAFGVPPERVVDVLALAGDSSDNVPGVKGIGMKTAAQLVSEYGDVEAVLAAAPTIKQAARRERLIEQAESARLSRRLVTIKDDVDIDIDLDAFRYDGPDVDKLRAIFERLEFKRLLSDPILGAAPRRSAPSSTSTSATPSRPAGPRATAPGQGDLFGAALAGPEPTPITVDRGRYLAVRSDADFGGLVDAIAGVDTLGVRALIDARDVEADTLVGLALAWGEGKGAYVPLGHKGDNLPLDGVIATLGPVLAQKGLVIEEGKDAIRTLHHAGFPELSCVGDPWIASYLLDPEANGHDVAAIAHRRFGHEALTRESVCGKGKGAKAAADLELDVATALAAEHADLSLRLHAPFVEELEAAGMAALYRDLELPLERVLARMEAVGLRIDEKILGSMSRDFEEELARIEKDAYAAAGEEFNLQSPTQISELLFGKLKLKVIKRTKTGASTDSSVLEQLQHEHALPGLILEHRSVAKLKNTYVDVLPRLVREETGRVHTRFNQTVAATGRLSSSDPNLQNIPIRTALGRKIRSAFVAAPGHKLISLDYSQIELRILAHVSGDPVLISTFENNEDVHQRTASEVFDVPLAEVSREQRTAAKAINFGLLYGMGVLRLARELGIKRSEAKEYLDRYFDRLAGIRAWNHDALERAHAQGFVTTLFGRRRLLPELRSANRGEVARGERLAINTPIQGSAADLIKRAMVETDALLAAEHPDVRLLLQVHDELLLEAPASVAEEVMGKVRKVMEGAAKLAVPLVVEGAMGDNWDEAH